MKVFIRNDSSYKIGSGHVMRCLTLADELKDNGAEVSFISRDLPGNISSIIEKRGYRCFLLPSHLGADLKRDAEETKEIIKSKKADWLIVDHYSLDEVWEKQLRPYVKKIMVIDDLADRKHDCDLILDQNLYEHMERRYNGLVPEKCIKLLGPQYALLRPEFKEARKKLRVRDGKIKRILVFFGGSDPTNETLKALEAIKMLNKPKIQVDVVIGASNKNKKTVEKMCSEMTNTRFHYQVENMAELMVKADLAIGAGGTTTWERCCLGLPSVIISIANNQVEIAKNISRKRIGYYLGRSQHVTHKDIYKNLEKLLKMPNLLVAISQKSLSLVDGEGIKRVCTAINKRGQTQ